MPADVLPFPQLSESLVDFCKGSANEFTRLTPEWVVGCFELDKALPDQYGWRLSDVSAIKQQMSGLKDVREINRVFWKDQAHNIQAYSVITFWRGTELIKAAIRSLNVGEVVAPAVLARALLELTSAYLLNANIIEKTSTELRFPPNTSVSSKYLEEQVLKMIWGTRLGEPEPHLKQSNIVTIIKKLSRNPKGAELLPKYEFLCEVAHPNVIGNGRYWSHVEGINTDGSKTVSLSRTAQGSGSEQILEATLWSLGWSAGTLLNGFAMIRKSLANILRKLEEA